MSILDILLLGVGLSMDAFAVSICKGLAMKKVNKKQCFVIALFFGGFQALMPTLGWLLGSTFANKISQYSGWIAFVLLLYIGGKMVIDAIKEWKENDTVSEYDPPLDIKELFIMAVATSIDALAVGVSFSLMEEFNVVSKLASSVTLIGCTTFVISAIGVFIGNIFGSKYKAKATLVGGFILIFLGVKILLEQRFGISMGF